MRFPITIPQVFSLTRDADHDFGIWRYATIFSDLYSYVLMHNTDHFHLWIHTI